MSQHYIFNEAGIIPGMPDGSFAGVRVDIKESGEVEVSPLAQHPHFEAAEESEQPVVGEEMEEGAAEEQIAEEAPPGEEAETKEHAVPSSEAAPAQEVQGEAVPEQPVSPPVEPSPEAAASEQA